MTVTRHASLPIAAAALLSVALAGAPADAGTATPQTTAATPQNAAATPQTTAASSAASSLAPADLRALEQAVREAMSARQVPGAAIALVKDGRVIYSQAFGVANLETGAPMTTEQLCRLGSTTKMFTGSAAVILHEQGRIDLKAPIARYLERLPPRLSKVTLHQLLSHTAGLRDFPTPTAWNDESALLANVRTWKDDVFFTDPGKIYSYSSPGYWLAGAVLEAAVKKPYADLMEELLFRPLGMNRTTFRPLMAMTWPFAHGHAPQEGKTTLVRPAANNTATWPSGSMYSNVGELARFAIAFMDGGRIDGQQVLPAALPAQVAATHILFAGENPGGFGYGYGVLSGMARGVRMVEHGGFSRGYGSQIRMAPEKRVAVVVVTNKSGEILRSATEKALESLMPLTSPEEAPRPPLPMTAAQLAEYSGVYEHAPFSWEIKAKDGKLILVHEGRESPMNRVGQDHFSYGEGEELVLTRDASGKLEHMFLGLYSARRRANTPASKP